MGPRPHQKPRLTAARFASLLIANALLAAALTLAACSPAPRPDAPNAIQAPERPTPALAPDASSRVLVDSIHAHNALSFGLAQGGHDYHKIHGYRLAFEHLQRHRIEHDIIQQGPLTPERLARFCAVFINLPSADLPPFTVPEIRALRRYIEAGGGLFVITDHSNCYLHAWKLMPLLQRLGIEVTTETACNEPPSPESL